MGYYELMGAVNNLYDVNDRLGVELMGAGRWNGLKKIVTQMSADAINKNYAPLMGWSFGKSINKVVKSPTRSISNVTNRINPNKVASSIRNIITKTNPSKFSNKVIKASRKVSLHGDDALCRQLWGFNEEYGEELLGGWWTDLKNGVAGTTHKILEIGSKIPVADAAVERFRDITGVITGAKTATDVATVAYDNRGKIILIGGALAIVLYLVLRDKKR